MTAYSNVQALFPTVFEIGSPPVGPRHWNKPPQFYLGADISLEFEADYGQDQDVTFNINPWQDSADHDGADDGLALPSSLSHCQATTLQFTVTVLDGAPAQAYVNVWFDWNRNGCWGDMLTCPGTAASEWAVQNLLVALPAPGSVITYTSVFLPFNPEPDRDMWLRITVSEVAAPEQSSDGSGPRFGYGAGETEDYLLPGLAAPTPTLAWRWVYLPIVVRGL